MTSTLALIYLFIELCAIALAMEAIYKARTSQGAIAWSISLVMMPLLAIPAYLLFAGRRFYGYVRARQAGDSTLQARTSTNTGLLRSEAGPHHVLENLTQLPMTDGNQCRLLINGESTFKEMFRSIEQARHYVLVQFYMVRDDRVGRAFQQLLIERARSGIKIYFLFDAIGSVDLGQRYLAEMEQAGITVQRFVSTKRWTRRWQINFRNHRKLIVVDGLHAFIGGLNIGDEYLGDKLEQSHWRDTHVVVSGPAAQCAQMTFCEDWYWGTQQTPDLHWPEPEVRAKGDQKVLVLATGPADARDACELSFLQLFAQARKRLWLVSPYFVPSESIIHGLQLAALRGVDVRILLPKKADNFLVQLSSYAYTEVAMKSGVKVYRYHAGFLHQKVLLLDDHTSLIGTANLDNRSLRLNFEIGALIYDEAFNQKVAFMLERDFKQSKESNLEDLRQRSLAWRFAVKLSCLMAPLQ